jgi:carbon monoxide dehydrogenase subunit G
MELTNDFTVNVPIEEAWSVLTDVVRIAPAMPGARLDAVEGGEYRGVVKVKVGPVTAEYRGVATFLERDPGAHRAVLRAQGREARGQGNATATVTATLAPEGTGTHVSVVTDLAITGRVAQFGRGVLADVSNKLLGQFVASLERTVLGGGRAEAAGQPHGGAKHAESTGTSSKGASSTGASSKGAGAGGIAGVTEVAPGVASQDSTRQLGVAPGVPGQAREVVPVDVERVVGPVIAKRALPILAVVAALFFWWRRRHAGR